MTTLLWHDYETWGINPKTDFPVQFAAIRTDLDFNVIGEPITLYAMPPVDRLPSPAACLVTGLTPQKILAETEYLSEVDFIKQINQLMSEPNTCSVGFNNIRFDDEVTRLALYRNLLDPYARESRNGRSRWDLIDVMRVARTLRPEGINWPFTEDGKASVKLELLTKANNIAHDAHDAVADVWATIAMAKLLKAKQPKLYDYAFNNRGKTLVKAKLNLIKPVMVLHISGMYPSENGNCAIVAPISQNPNNANAITVFDLNFNPEVLLENNVKTLNYLTFTKQVDLQPNEQRLPIKDVHINKCPILVPLSTLTPDIANKYNIDIAKCTANFAKLQAMSGVNTIVGQVMSLKKFTEPDDAELALYNGFIPDQDKYLCQQIHNTAPEKWQNIQFKDARLQQLWPRFKARNYPELLTEAEAETWKNYCHNKINLQLPEFEQQLAELSKVEDLSVQDQKILQQLSQLAK